MRWFVDVSSVQKGSDRLRYCVEADSWQRALQSARALRDDPGPMTGFSIELQDEGFNAVDPVKRQKYAIRKAPVEQALTTATHKPEVLPAEPSLSSRPPPPAPPAEEGADAAIPKSRSSRPPAPDLNLSPKGAKAKAKATPAPPSVAPASVAPRSEPPRPHAAARRTVEVLAQRVQDPGPQGPLTYREFAYFVEGGATHEEAERLLRDQLERVQESVAAAQLGKLVNLALFTTRFTGRPTAPPLATLMWKDWRGIAVVAFPDPNAPRVSNVPPSSLPVSAKLAVAAAAVPTAAPAPPVTATASPAAAESPPAAPPVAALPRPSPSASPPAPVTPPPALEPAPQVVLSPPASSGPVTHPSPSLPAAVAETRVTSESAAPPVVVAPPAAAAPAPVVAAPAPVAAAPAPVAAAPAPVAAAPAPVAVVPAPATPPPAIHTAPVAEPPGSVAPDSIAPPTTRGPDVPVPAPPVVKPRLRGDELIADLFESMHDLQFLQDSIEGADFCLSLALEKMPATGGVVHLYDIDHREFVITCAGGPGGEGLLMQRNSEHDPILAPTMRKRRPLVLADATTSEHAQTLPRYGALGGARSLMVAPVALGGRFLGAIELLNPIDGIPFTEDDGHALAYIAEQLASFVAERGILMGRKSAPPPAPIAPVAASATPAAKNRRGARAR